MAGRVIGKIVASPGGKTVVLVGPQWFKLIHVMSLPQGKVLSKLVAVSIGGLEDAQAIEAIQGAAAAAGVAIGRVWVATPSQLTTMRLLSLPSADPKEIREMTDLQVEKNTPHAKEEVLSDSTLVETDASGYSRVLLAIVHRDVIGRGVRIVEALPWRVDGVVCEAEGLHQWYRWVRPQEAQSDAATLLVEIDTESTTLLVSCRGRIYFHRSIAWGAGGQVDELIPELQRSCEAFEAEGMNVSLQGVVLTGLTDALTDLPVKIQQTLNLPAQLIPMFERCPATKAANAAAAQISHQASFASLVGSALGSLRLDLTPPTVKLRQTFEKRVHALMGLSTRAAAFLLIVCLLAFSKTYRYQRYHDLMVQEHLVMDEPARQIAQTLERLHVIQNRMRKRGFPLEVMEAVSRLSPAAIRLSSFNYTLGEPVLIKGISRELPSVYEFVDTLGKEPIFTKVEARRVSKRKVDGQDLTDFEIVCTLSQEQPVR